MKNSDTARRSNFVPPPVNSLGEVTSFKKKEQLPAKAQKLLQKGMVAYKTGGWETAASFFEQAWVLAPESFTVLTALAQTYSEIGVRDKAFELLEKGLAQHGPNETLLAIMGQMAVNMSEHDIAEKVWRMILPFNPDNVSYYVNLASSMINQEKFDDALSLLQETVNMFPDEPLIWNSLGVAAQATERLNEARAFYRQAISLNDKDHRFWSNLASTEEDRNTVLAFSQKALDLNPDCHETHMLLANLNFRQGFVAAAWDHWEHRLVPERAKGQNTIFKFDFPHWEGQCLADKTLLVSGEQGIGDEVFFYKSLEMLSNQAEQLVIAAEPRLVSILRRSFPSAIVEPYETETIYGHSYRGSPAIENRLANSSLEIDYFSPIGSTWPHTWGPRRFDIPTHPNGYLTADPALTAKWRKRLSALGGDLMVGVSWTSQNLKSSRSGGYTNVDFLEKIAAMDRVTLVCLQYGDVETELETFRERTGYRIHSWKDLNLKADIEANLAIMANLDFVIGPATATQMFAMASGAKTLLLARGRPWWTFGTTLDEKELYYAPNLRWIDNHIHELPYGTPEREAYDFWREARDEVQGLLDQALAEKGLLNGKAG